MVLIQKLDNGENVMNKENIFEGIYDTDTETVGINWLRYRLEEVEGYLCGNYDMNRIDEMKSNINDLLDWNTTYGVNKTCESMLKLIESL